MANMVVGQRREGSSSSRLGRWTCVLVGCLAATVVFNGPALSQPAAIVEADVSVFQTDPHRNFGASTELWADESTAKHTFVRVRVSAVGAQSVVGAYLTMRVADAYTAGSVSGGSIHVVSDCEWDELAMTWATQLVIDGAVLDEVEAVQRGQAVAFDVTGAITGDGAFCFGLVSNSADAVAYHASEAQVGGPEVEIITGELDTCGDGTVNHPSEQCDGTDDAACPGSCQPDCTCPGQTSTTTTTTTWPNSTTTTLPAAVCGDGMRNQAGEECDGVDDSTCRGGCQPDCTCAFFSPTAIMEADVSVRESHPDQNFGGSGQVWVDGLTGKYAFFRVQVSGIETRPVLSAYLRLQVADVINAESDSGGRIHHIAVCDWDEMAVTWNQRPVIDGAVLDEVGAVQRGEVVRFEVTEAVTTDGTFCFAVDSLSPDGVTYQSSESLADGPEMEIIAGEPAVCGDGMVNQEGEQCDGSDAWACPGACQEDCTCRPPVCGDHRINQQSEECDGPDDTACPGACQNDCTCDIVHPVGIVDADVGVRAEDPGQNFGASSLMFVDADVAKRTFLRIQVRGVGAKPILSVGLRLQLADLAKADSDSGGRIHPIAACSWEELEMTWNTQPPIDGPVLDEIGPVERGGVVEFDLTSAIDGDGTYCFALDSLSSNSAKYASREALVGRPAVEVVVAGICGDGRVNGATEQCDGFDDEACPAACLADCTCAVCGNDVVEAPVESCDGTDDVQCPGECGADCTCPLLPPPPFACLGQGGPTITPTGSLLDTLARDELEPGSKIDSRQATFLGWPGTGHQINLDGSPGICVAGGAVLGQYDRAFSWGQVHASNNAGIAFKNSHSIVDGLRVDNVGDGIRPRDGGSFTIRNTWLSYIRDDCVENDHLQDGLVEDSLFDGCYVAFSSRPSDANIAAGFDGSGKVWTIRSSLIRLEAMPGPPEGSSDGLGHGGFFKWHLWNDPASSLSPKLALHDNIFMAERVGQVGEERMGTPPDQVLDCSNNVMVWLGPGEFPGTLPACFTITTDRSVWDDAVADWFNRHPQVGR